MTPLHDAKQDDRIDYIEMAATSITDTKRFYTVAFGWKFTDYGPDYTSFEDGRLSGGFYKAESARAGTVLVVIFALDLAARAECPEGRRQDCEAAVQLSGGQAVSLRGPER